MQKIKASFWPIEGVGWCVSMVTPRARFALGDNEPRLLVRTELLFFAEHKYKPSSREEKENGSRVFLAHQTSSPRPNRPGHVNIKNCAKKAHSRFVNKPKIKA